MRMWPAILACPLIAGCVGFGCPALSKTSTVAAPESDVRAFRETSEFTMSGPAITGPVRVSSEIKAIPVENGAVAPQRDAYFAYYYLVFAIANGEHTRSLRVLLYRPGYETVEIPARPWWQSLGVNVPEKVAWKEARDLPTQKAAVDRIASRGRGQTLGKDVLQFAAGEYARLADSPMAASPAMSATKDEIRRLARECYDQAAKENP